MHEIITLQLGQKSNYLATHFWNTQESYFTYSENEESIVNHDVHFRAGFGADGSETFTPRTVIYDLKGGFGSLRKLNALYDVQDDTGSLRGLWDGSTATQKQPPIQPTRYQILLEQGLPTFQLQDSDVRYWSDFNRVFYHPRSVVQLNEYELHSQIMPFDNWSAGEDLFRDLDRESDLLDRDVRPFAEECDQLQGLQILTGTDDAWGGFASKYLDSLRDEYGKTSIWVWGLEDGIRVQRPKQLARSANAARSLRAMGQQASAYIRLACPPTQVPNYISLASNSEWFSTALLCSAFESITLPARLATDRARCGSLSLLEDILNTNGKQNLYELHLSVWNASQFNGEPKGNLANGFHDADVEIAEDTVQEDTKFDLGFSPTHGNVHSTSSHTFGRVESDRGVDSAILPAIDVEEMLRRKRNEETVVDRFQTSLRFPQLDTSPENLFQVRRPREGLAISAALTTSSNIKGQVMRLRNDTSRLVDVDEREALYNDLTDIANGYSFAWDGGSDSGGDS